MSRRPLFLLSSVAGPSDYVFYAYLEMTDCHGSINPNRPGEGMGGGGGGAESARADFRPSSNTYEILPLLLKFIGEQGFVKNFCQGYNFYFLHLINDFFKTIANSLSQSQEIDNIS